MNPITVKLMSGAVALAGATVVALMGRAALYDSGERPDAGPSVEEVSQEELGRARQMFEHRELETWRVFLFDKSLSFEGPSGRTCRGCKGMGAAGIAAIRLALRNLLGAATLPAATRVVLTSLGSGSFGPNAYQRNVDVRYEPLPEPPEGWGSTDPLALTLEQIAAVDTWRTVFRAWQDDARQHSEDRRAELEAAIAGLERHPAEMRTDIVSAIEAALRVILAERGADVRVHLTLIGDLEEDLDGHGKQHTAAALATWCERSDGLAFPERTEITVYVSTTAGTLQHIERRWKPFFVGCGVDPARIRFLPLYATPVAEQEQ